VNKPFVHVYGVYRPLEDHLIQLANMYLSLNKHNNILHWFNGEEGKFVVALGADGAPFGKDETATAFLVSFLNILDGVQSCDNNYLLMGANCDECHPLMFAYTQHVFQEMKRIENKNFEIQGTKVSFECKMIPSDQKWIASMGGELNNASKYFSSYGNVCKENKKTVGGTLGTDSNCTWKPWTYEKRLTDVLAVSNFKKQKKIEEYSKDRNVRTKVTTFISSRNSRQEFVPFLDTYVNYVKPEPLHNTNNAWQAWNADMLATSMKLTDNKDLEKSNGNIDSLPHHSAIRKYVKCLETTLKAGRLAKNIRRWFPERKAKGKEMFSYRFTGKESKLFCWYFAYLCRELINTAGIGQTTLCHILCLALSGLSLRNSVALYSRVHITQAELDILDRECELYFNCQVMLLGSVSPTTWTIGKAVPYYNNELYKELGFGLGLNSMQGREAKHTRLACYTQNTTRGKHLRWWQVFKHEFMETIWLRLKQPEEIRYRRGCIIDNEAPQPVKQKEQYIPPWCDTATNCCCGLPMISTECEICDSKIFQLAKKSCLNGRLESELKLMIGTK